MSFSRNPPIFNPIELPPCSALAAAHDVMVVPHGSSVYSYHLQFAFPNCPIAEFLNMSPNADKEREHSSSVEFSFRSLGSDSAKLGRKPIVKQSRRFFRRSDEILRESR